MQLVRLALAGIPSLVILAPALLSFGSSSASGLSPQLADAPTGLVPHAFQVGAMTGIDANVLLAIAKVETDWGRARQGQLDELVPADVAPASTRPRSSPTARRRPCSACPTAAASAIGGPVAGRRRARHGLHAVPALHLAHWRQHRVRQPGARSRRAGHHDVAPPGRAAPSIRPAGSSASRRRPGQPTSPIDGERAAEVVLAAAHRANLDPVQVGPGHHHRVERWAGVARATQRGGRLTPT
ncbi:MAG TPA: hypothetical protein VLW53_11750 [Candidatus Eisenbacteria bacterium]|nr:hypothetical protein [Candidatus Eisenbacteria bacterium]